MLDTMITGRVPGHKVAQRRADRSLWLRRSHFTGAEGEELSPPRPAIRSRIRDGEEKAIEMLVGDVPQC